jgi:hypothetical protein
MKYLGDTKIGFWYNWILGVGLHQAVVCI